MRPEHRPELEQLVADLRARAGDEPVAYTPNPGNWGDALIRAGTEHLLAEHGLVVEPWPLPRRGASLRARRRLGLWGGGGGWCRFWDYSDRVRQWARSFESIVVLPSSYDGRFEIPHAVFYARDRFESLDNMPGATFCHDLSLALDSLSGPPPTRREGWFFRDDRERKPGRPRVVGNEDISARGNVDSPLEPFVAALAACEVIHTDRLHVAIAGCLLGRSVHLHASGYFKNEAVYRSSLQGCYPGLVFHA